MASPIPAIYRYWFHTIHPLLSMTGVVSHLLAPEEILKGYSTSAILPPPIEASVLVAELGGYKGGFALIELILLRARPTDVNLWRILESCWLFVDVVVFASHLWAISAQGRLDLAELRPLDWPHVIIAGWLICLRTAFALGIGLKAEKSKST